MTGGFRHRPYSFSSSNIIKQPLLCPQHSPGTAGARAVASQGFFDRSSDQIGFAFKHCKITNKSIIRLEIILKFAISLYDKDIIQKGKTF